MISEGDGPRRFAARSAIDMHVHVTEGTGEAGRDAASRSFQQAAASYFGSDAQTTVGAIADYYRRIDISCVVFAVDSESTTGRKPVASEEIAELAAEHADVMIPFGSVDPWRGEVARRSARRLIEHYGVKGFKFHPSTQGFEPNDTRFYPLYELIESAGLPVVFHTGQTGIGAKMRGGGGIRLKYSNPMLLDDVAADFPDLTIIMAHPSVPWQDEGLAVALHKQNVYIDLSGWSPKYFEPKLVTYVKRLLTDKVMFGSDYPLITPQRWLDDFAGLGFDEDVTRKVLRGNALRVLGGANSTAGQD
ncbi:amidohydrolase family protein [Plantactinospora alkalitolerans]|uniref:amidohydrolase family protein n=1 Tax=Plantactinospora alkalitolerans TaxID=2789879 RepID=UPI002B20DE56|nr:amidohydrolase family protein [Plantactinospora alkalitolerans]